MSSSCSWDYDRLHFACFVTLWTFNDALAIVFCVDPPTVKQLVKAVASVSDWRTLGLYLGLEQAVLTDIHTTHHVEGLNTLKMVMFDKWLKKCPRASWDDLIEALTDIGEVTTADQVKASRP